MIRFVSVLAISASKFNLFITTTPINNSTPSMTRQGSASVRWRLFLLLILTLLIVGAVSKKGNAKGKNKKVPNQYLIRFKEGKQEFLIINSNDPPGQTAS